MFLSSSDKYRSHTEVVGCKMECLYYDIYVRCEFLPLIKLINDRTKQKSTSLNPTLSRINLFMTHINLFFSRKNRTLWTNLTDISVSHGTDILYD